jgi:hypothetical protein
MKVRILETHEAGAELWRIAGEYKQSRSDLSDRLALKLALLSNPELAECYLGCPVRRDAVYEVRKFLANTLQ